MCEHPVNNEKIKESLINLFSVFNTKGWIPKHECHNGNKNCHHQSAPRGSKTGTQGKSGSYERSKIPQKLV